MKNLYLSLVYVCIVFTTQAQEYFESLPENPGPNVCFAKCVVPDEYREEVVRVMTKPEYTVLEVIPAEYETKTEEIIVKPASIKFQMFLLFIELFTILFGLWNLTINLAFLPHPFQTTLNP